MASAASAAVAVSASASATVTRYAGPDRYATSAAIVDANYRSGVPVAYIATGENFPDALAGGAAAAKDGGPLLLVRHDAVPAAIATELTKLAPAKIVILGGTLSVSAAVETALQAYTSGTVTRVAGSNRYATAATLAETFPSGSPVYVATGANFPDALAATAAAAHQHAAILLTDPWTLPPSTASALAQLHPSSITIVGSTNAVSTSVESSLASYSSSVVRVSGADRYATAAAVAQSAFPSATGVFIATGGAFADALTGGPVAGTLGQPLLLAMPACLPQQTAAEVSGLNPTTVTLLGGTASLSDAVGSLTPCSTTQPTGVTFGDGTHQLGSALPAGTYRTRADVAGCYWARLSGFSGQLSDVIENNLSDYHQVVTIEPTDAGFESDGCGTWTNNLSALTSSPTAPFGNGQWIVGTDISAGTWSAPGGPNCYWERESDFTGDINSVIANDLSAVTPVVTISATDAGFTSEDCGTWTKQ